MAVVLITGCSSGFGVEFAAAFARRGDTVVASMRDVSRASRLQERLGREGLSVDVRALDVTDAESVATLVSHVGRVDVLVNNAGIGAVSALETLDGALLRQVFETNVFGALAMTQAVLPGMRAQGSGRVVMVSAIGAVLNTAFLGAYCASKHALDCLAATLDIETRPFGIRVSSVLPGAFNTGMADNIRREYAEPYADAAQRYYEGLTARMAAGGRDLSAVTDAVVEAATADDPKLRYLVAPHLAEVLGPVMDGLEQLHQRELAMQKRA
jgi:NAD(P)-dependent dehydrogenase (short-subunit alcohol dehydrogenase family)